MDRGGRGKLTCVLRSRFREVEGVEPLKNKVLERYERFRRYLDQCVASGIIDASQHEVMAERFMPEGEEVADLPLLWPELAPVLASWDLLGAPVAVMGGMAGMFLDRRPECLLARLAWLNEQEVRSRDVRAVYLLLWSSLDDERMSIEAEAQRRRS